MWLLNSLRFSVTRDETNMGRTQVKKAHEGGNKGCTYRDFSDPPKIRERNWQHLCAIGMPRTRGEGLAQGNCVGDVDVWESEMMAVIWRSPVLRGLLHMKSYNEHS